MQKLINKVLLVALILAGIAGYSYYKGRVSAFYDLSIEKCTLDSNMDVSCFYWINK